MNLILVFIIEKKRKKDYSTELRLETLDTLLVMWLYVLLKMKISSISHYKRRAVVWIRREFCASNELSTFLYSTSKHEWWNLHFHLNLIPFSRQKNQQTTACTIRRFYQQQERCKMRQQNILSEFLMWKLSTLSVELSNISQQMLTVLLTGVSPCLSSNSTSNLTRHYIRNNNFPLSNATIYYRVEVEVETFSPQLSSTSPSLTHISCWCSADDERWWIKNCFSKHRIIIFYSTCWYFAVLSVVLDTEHGMSSLCVLIEEIC